MCVCMCMCVCVRERELTRLSLCVCLYVCVFVYMCMYVCVVCLSCCQNIVMFGVLRRTGILVVLVLEFLLLGKRASPKVVAATIVMVAGVVTAGFADLSYDPYGYVLAFITNIATAVYVVLIKYIRTKVGLDAFGMLLYNAVSYKRTCSLTYLLTDWLSRSLSQLQDY